MQTCFKSFGETLRSQDCVVSVIVSRNHETAPSAHHILARARLSAFWVWTTHWCAVGSPHCFPLPFPSDLWGQAPSRVYFRAIYNDILNNFDLHLFIAATTSLKND
jgi:hypothetical protein